ncbi:MAG: cysteine desulfurase family protein [Pseudomonadota bacterium]
MTTYLDHNATTPLDLRVREAMMPFLGEFYGNASSVHRHGRLMRGALDRAREQVATLVGAHPSQVIFTSGGTEANNLAIRGVCEALEATRGKPGRLLIGRIEHPCVLEPAERMAQLGWQLDWLDVDGEGRYRADRFTEALAASPDLVSLMLANNETGTLQDLAPLAAQAREHGELFHTDATQAAGKCPVDFKALGANLMTLSSHKLYGPLGAGALISDKTVSLSPQIRGGGHESGMRSGTENIAAIVGFGAACELALAELDERRQHMLALRQRLEAGLDRLPGVHIFARGAERLPNTVQFGIDGIHGETTLMKLDVKGVAVSSGSACHADQSDPSHVLLAMGVDSDTALTAIRASIGKDSSEADIDRLLTVLADILDSPLNSAAAARDSAVASGGR